MGVSTHLPPGGLRALAETHPQLTRLRARLVDDLHIEPTRAGRLIVGLLTHAVEDLGDAFLGEMGRRIRRIDSIRGRIAGAVDQVLSDGALPADLDHASLSHLFDDLQREMEGLQSARRFAETHPHDSNIEAITGAMGPTAEPTAAARPFAPTDDKLQGVAGASPRGMLRDAMSAMETQRPARAKLFHSIMDQHGDKLALAVLADTQSAQQAALRDLRDVLGPTFPPDKFEELRGAVEELGQARGRALHGSDTPAARVRAERVADLPPELRAEIGGDNTLLGPLAEQSPADLQSLWDAWVSKGRNGKFRDYVYGEMRSGRRPALAEWQTAHDVANQHKLALLKDPATYDPAQPNLRRVNPREGGSDIVGLRDDGEIWYVDDKSHRVSPTDAAAGQTGINLSGVSAFEETLAPNMLADAADMDAALARIATDGHVPDVRAVEAAARIRRCGDQLTTLTQGWGPKDYVVPANQTAVRAILDANRVKLKVTSAMGDVTGMTNRLKGLGIEVLPQFVPVTRPDGSTFTPPRINFGRTP